MIKSGEGPDLFPIPVGLTLNTAVEEGWFLTARIPGYGGQIDVNISYMG